MPLMILIFIIIILPIYGQAAPVGNIGDPILWRPSPFEKNGGLSFVASLNYDTQTNHLPEQMTRFAWTNPNVIPLEQRHYHQIRASKNTLNSIRIKMGVPLNDRVIVYGIAGTCKSKIDFHYEDWTVSRSYYSDDTFESDSDIIYGVGSSIVMQRLEYSKIPLTVGMDISYLRYSVEEDRFRGVGLSYSSRLDEIQLAISFSSELRYFSPYVGVKVASITGSEEYINGNYETSYSKDGYIHYSQDITWSKNVGYFMGATTSINGWVTLGIEFRGGDENAMGITSTTRF